MTRRNKALIKELSTPPPGAEDLYFSTQYSQSSLQQFKSCLWKQWWTYWRTPDYNLVRFFFTFTCALMLGSIFWKVGTKRYELISSYNKFKLQSDSFGWKKDLFKSSWRSTKLLIFPYSGKTPLI